MLYNELLDRLQNLTNRKPSQAELIQILNIKQSTMSERARRNSKFSPKEIDCLNDYYGINLYTSKVKANRKISDEYSNNINTQGKRLKKIRQVLNINQEDLAKAINLPKQIIANIEADKVLLNNEKLIALGENFNISLNYLLLGKGEMFIKNSSSEIKDYIKQSLKEMFQTGELNKEFFLGD